MRTLPTSVVVVAGAVAACVVTLLSLGVGVIPVSFSEVARALGDVAAPNGSERALFHTLVVDMRLPRAVGALCVGSALGAAGCMLHALLRNPLASPSVIGTAQAAGFGSVVAILFGLPYLVMLGLSFGMAVIAAFAVLALARTRTGLPTITVVLTGLSVSLFFGALIGLAQYMSRDEGQLGRMVMRLLGGLWQVTWEPLAVLAPITVVTVAASLLFARRLDLLALGESDAQRLGIDVRRTGTLVLLVACLLTSLAVCLAGVVAFVGLIVPHAARRIVGPAHGALLPASAFLGGIVVVLTDTVARTIVPPNELPLGVVTSLLGVPCFLLVLRSMRTWRGES